MSEEATGAAPESSELQLQSYMESLELSPKDEPIVILDTENNSPCVSQKMTLRKKIRPLPDFVKKRVQIQPKKLSPDINDEESLKLYYININKKFKTSPKACLETIFEEPHNKLDKIIYLGTRKIRRALNLKQNGTLSSKIKKRKTRIKKFFGKLNRFKSVSNAQLISQLATLDESED